MIGTTLENLVKSAKLVDSVKRKDLSRGNRVVISTKKSLYALTARGDGTFEVSGGWFEHEGAGPCRVEVRGCAAGSHAIFTDHIAKRGLFIEFADGLRKPRIRSIGQFSARDLAPSN